MEFGGPARANAACPSHSQETVERPCLHSPTGLRRVGSIGIGSLRLWRAAATQDRSHESSRAPGCSAERAGQKRQRTKRVFGQRLPRTPGYVSRNLAGKHGILSGTAWALSFSLFPPPCGMGSPGCSGRAGYHHSRGGGELGECAAHNRMCTCIHAHMCTFSWL